MTQTKAQLQSRNQQLEHDNSLLIQAVNAIVNGEKVYIGKRNHHSVSLLRPEAAHGGIVLITYNPPGQSPHSAAYYLDDWHSWCQDQFTVCPTDENFALRELSCQAKRVQHAVQQPKPVETSAQVPS